jgi:RIO kinase 2
LAKVGLIARLKNAKYDGYRLTYGGLDYLSLNTYRKRNEVYSVGNQIGIGKESDIFVVADEKGTQKVLKVHRLGRISFRTVKANRDYLRNKSGGSWMYMSRLAAIKEFTFMKALRENGFPVPEPIAQSRHTIVMSLIDAFPLRQIASVPDPPSLYAELISMILRLAQYGLIHGDFNEFNILIEEKTVPKSNEPKSPQHNNSSSATISDNITLNPILIDFPQMVSVDHTNAEMYFDRDVNCIKRFFQRRFHFTSHEPGPFFADARKLIGKDGAKRLDVAVEASGFSRKMAKELEAYMAEIGVDGDGEPGAKRGDEDEEEGEEETEAWNEEEDENEEENKGGVDEDNKDDMTNVTRADVEGNGAQASATDRSKLSAINGVSETTEALQLLELDEKT